MSNIPAALFTCPLFNNIDPADLNRLLDCLGAVRRRYPKGGMILHMGAPVSDVGIVIKGMVHVVQEDFWGVRTLLSAVGPGGLFAEAFSMTGTLHLPVSALAAEDVEVLFVDYSRIASQCPMGCDFHGQLIRNMLNILAHKNLTLTQKLWHVTRRTTRQKLLSYLSSVSAELGQQEFSIPYNRQDLADFLAVDRSAMSSELARMQKEGILRYERNNFTLLKPL